MAGLSPQCDDQDLLPAQLPGPIAVRTQRPLLSDFRRSPACRVPRLQTLPSGRVTGFSRMEYAGRRRGAGQRGLSPTARSTASCHRMAARLGYTPRQLERLLQVEVGAGPLAPAHAQRAQTARILIETTDLPFADVAFALVCQHPSVQ